MQEHQLVTYECHLCGFASKYHTEVRDHLNKVHSRAEILETLIIPVRENEDLSSLDIDVACEQYLKCNHVLASTTKHKIQLRRRIIKEVRERLRYDHTHRFPFFKYTVIIKTDPKHPTDDRPWITYFRIVESSKEDDT
jgi:hypothetical protein